MSQAERDYYAKLSELSSQLNPPGLMSYAVIANILWFILIALQAAALGLPWYEVDLLNANSYNGARPSAGPRVQGGRFSLTTYADCARRTSGQVRFDFTCDFYEQKTFPSHSVGGPGGAALASMSEASFALLLLCLFSSILGLLRTLIVSTCMVGGVQQLRKDPFKLQYYTGTCIQLGVQTLFVLAATTSYLTSIPGYVRTYMGGSPGPTGEPRYAAGARLAIAATVLTFLAFCIRLYVYHRVLTFSKDKVLPEIPDPPPPATPEQVAAEFALAVQREMMAARAAGGAPGGVPGAGMTLEQQAALAAAMAYMNGGQGMPIPMPMPMAYPQYGPGPGQAQGQGMYPMQPGYPSTGQAQEGPYGTHNPPLAMPMTMGMPQYPIATYAPPSQAQHQAQAQVDEDPSGPSKPIPGAIYAAAPMPAPLGLNAAPQPYGGTPSAPPLGGSAKVL